MEQTRVEQKKNPRDEAGFFSIVFFWWMNPLLALGYNRDLELEDLFQPRKEDESEVPLSYLMTRRALIIIFRCLVTV